MVAEKIYGYHRNSSKLSTGYEGGVTLRTHVEENIKKPDESLWPKGAYERKQDSPLPSEIPPV